MRRHQEIFIGFRLLDLPDHIDEAALKDQLTKWVDATVTVPFDNLAVGFGKIENELCRVRHISTNHGTTFLNFLARPRKSTSDCRIERAASAREAQGEGVNYCLGLRVSIGDGGLHRSTTCFCHSTFFAAATNTFVRDFAGTSFTLGKTFSEQPKGLVMPELADSGNG
jgi:hypothetical protein